MLQNLNTSFIQSGKNNGVGANHESEEIKYIMFVSLELEFRIYLKFRLFEEFNYYVFAVYISF